MPISPGTRLGPYEVTAQIGVGGMGEVYKATDTNLKRQVAIKMLPATLAGDPERLARFQREAEVLASLNHPNIAHIHGLEKTGGTIALVMELVEGPTLAERIAQGAIPLDEALPIAKQIAEALEAAHEQGIIHRDLKPANIKVRPDGTVKVLDFGLAKAMEPAGVSAPSLSMSPTMTSPAMTQAGVILGTAAYMSPEQAKGKAVDRKTDIWAFGCLLYEMLTGRRSFDAGDSVSEAIANILKTEPDWTALPADTPLSIRRLLRRCLNKDARQREPHIGAARLTIDEAREGLKDDSSTLGLAAPVRPQGWGATIGWATAAAVLAAAVVSGAFLLRQSVPVTERTVTFEIAAPDGWRLGSPGANTATAPFYTVSADGTQIVFVASPEKGGPTELWIRRLANLEAVPIRGTEGAQNPFWSPDAGFVAFFADGKLKKIDPSGGTAQSICDVGIGGGGGGGAWSDTGEIVFPVSGRTAGPQVGLMRVSSAGGTPVPVTTLGADERSHVSPQFLPDGRRFLYLALRREGRKLYVASLDGTEPALVLESASRARYASGRLLFVTDDGTLMAQPFDPTTARTTDNPRPLIEGVAVNASSGNSSFAVSQSGMLAYRPGPSASNDTYQLYWADRGGKKTEDIGKPQRGLNALRLSPNDKQLAAQIVDANGLRDWWILDLDRGGVSSRLTSTGDVTDGDRLAWSPDGKRVVFGKGTPAALVTLTVDSREEPQRLYQSVERNNPYDWSSDGRILFAHTTPQNPDLWTISDRTHEGRPLVSTRYAETNARFSPDGKWVAYASDEEGPIHVYVSPASESNSRAVKTSENQASAVRWVKDELFLFANRTLMVVDVRSDGTSFKPGPARQLFTDPDVFAPRFEVKSDGQRFLRARSTAAAAEGESRSAPLTVVVNWQTLLK